MQFKWGWWGGQKKVVDEDCASEADGDVNPVVGLAARVRQLLEHSDRTGMG